MILTRIAALAAITLALTISAQAWPHKAHHHRQQIQSQSAVITCNQQGCSDRMAYAAPVSNKRMGEARIETAGGGESYLPHPQGCPRVAFCACGAAVEIFGKSIRELWPARAWYKFPRTSPGYKMVAVKNHHVFVLRTHIEGTVWLVADYNSGGHQSRLHERDIRGYTIVNPHGALAGL